MDTTVEETFLYNYDIFMDVFCMAYVQLGVPHKREIFIFLEISCFWQHWNDKTRQCSWPPRIVRSKLIKPQRKNKLYF